MDKITRLLLLYSCLLRGEKVNKFQFCMETGCSLRAFDRDVEDIRLYLSDSFSGSEILYDRKDNEYFMSNSRTPPFDLYEFFIMERLLVASKALRADELSLLLEHIAGNTERGYLRVGEIKNKLHLYQNENTDVPLIKLHGDLTRCIYRNRIICITYQTDVSVVEEIEVVPFDIRLEAKGLWLVAVRVGEKISNLQRFKLSQIMSFIDIRECTLAEQKQSKLYRKQEEEAYGKKDQIPT